MTQRGGRVDWDRLADHLSGAQAGTPEEVEVDRLVATDPSWAQAAEQLSVALEAVAADLRSLPAPAMPVDVAARLEQALRAAPGVASGGAPAPAESPPLPAQRAGATPPPGRPAGRAAGPPGRPGARPRRRRVARWGAGAALAAGVVAFGAIGLAALSPSSPLTIAGGSDADRSDASDEPPAVVELPSGGFEAPLVLATGTDYQPPTVVTAEPMIPTVGGEPAPELGPAGDRNPFAQPPDVATSDDRIPDLVPGTLARLWADPASRDRCLELVRAALEPAPVVIDTVDFARFGGVEALVIWATAADGGRVVWVAGPDCGTDPAGPDRLFQTRG